MSSRHYLLGFSVAHVNARQIGLDTLGQGTVSLLTMRRGRGEVGSVFEAQFA